MRPLEKKAIFPSSQRHAVAGQAAHSRAAKDAQGGGTEMQEAPELAVEHVDEDKSLGGEGDGVGEGDAGGAQQPGERHGKNGQDEDHTEGGGQGGESVLAGVVGAHGDLEQGVTEQAEQEEARCLDDQLGAGAVEAEDLDNRRQDEGDEDGQRQGQCQDGTDAAVEGGGVFTLFAAGDLLREGGQQGGAHGGADEGLGHLEDQPAEDQGGDGAGGQARGQVVLDDEDHLDGEHGEDARAHEAEDAADALSCRPKEGDQRK